MPEKKIEGVEVDGTENKKMERTYTESDVRVVMRRGHWQSWGEIINWLETEGEKDNELTPGETIALVLDLRQVQNSGEQFTNDPHRVYQLMRQHHGAPEAAPSREAEARSEEERRREAEARAEEERRREAEHRREVEARHEAERREEVQPEEVPAGEPGLYSEKGILRRGGYIWR